MTITAQEGNKLDKIQNNTVPFIRHPSRTYGQPLEPLSTTFISVMTKETNFDKCRPLRISRSPVPGVRPHGKLREQRRQKPGRLREVVLAWKKEIE